MIQRLFLWFFILGTQHIVLARGSSGGSHASSSSHSSSSSHATTSTSHGSTSSRGSSSHPAATFHDSPASTPHSYKVSGRSKNDIESKANTRAAVYGVGAGVITYVVLDHYLGYRPMYMVPYSQYHHQSPASIDVPRPVDSEECVKKCVNQTTKNTTCNVVCVCPQCLSKFLCTSLAKNLETLNQSILTSLNQTTDLMEHLDQFLNKLLKEKRLTDAYFLQMFESSDLDFSAESNTRDMVDPENNIDFVTEDNQNATDSNSSIMDDLATNLTRSSKVVLASRVARSKTSNKSELLMEYIQNLTDSVNYLCKIYGLEDEGSETNTTALSCGTYQREDCQDICPDCQTDFICNKTVDAAYQLAEVFGNGTATNGKLAEMVNLCQRIDGYEIEYTYTYSRGSQLNPGNNLHLILLSGFVGLFTTF